MKIAVCDNESYFVENIIGRIVNAELDNDIITQIDGYKNSTQFLVSFQKIEYDLVYLDIEMNEIDGISLAEEIHRIKASCIIIFVSGYLQYIHDSFSVNAFQFITKPINDELFDNELRRAIYKYQRLNYPTLFHTTSGKRYIRNREILYIETSYENYRVCTTKVGTSYYGNIKAIQNIKKKLLEYNFYLINRSFLINMEYIEHFEPNYLTMTNGDRIMVSRRKWNHFKESYLRYLKQGKEDGK